MSNSATILSCFTIPTSSGMTDVQWVWWRRAYVCTYTDDPKPSIGLPRWTYVNFRKPLAAFAAAQSNSFSTSFAEVFLCVATSGKGSCTFVKSKSH